MIFVMLLFAFEDNSIPRKESVSFERRPIISRNQGAQAQAKTRANDSTSTQGTHGCPS